MAAPGSGLHAFTSVSQTGHTNLHFCRHRPEQYIVPLAKVFFANSQDYVISVKAFCKVSSCIKFKLFESDQSTTESRAAG